MDEDTVLSLTQLEEKYIIARQEISARWYKLRDDLFGATIYELIRRIKDVKTRHSVWSLKLSLILIKICLIEIFENIPGLLLVLITSVYAHLNGIIISLLLTLLNRSSLLIDSPDWRQAHSKLKERLLWQSVLPLPILMHYFLKADIQCHFADSKSRSLVNNEDFNLLVTNHYSRIDKIFYDACIVSNRLVQRSVIHSAAKLFPIVGTSYWPIGYVFARPGSKVDHLVEQTDSLVHYKKIVLTLLAEGEWPNKYSMGEAQKLCERKGMQPFRYHLVPKSGAFIAILCSAVRNLREQNKQRRAQNLPERRINLINTQCLQPVRWKLWDLVRCRRGLKMDFCFEQVELTDEHIQEALDSKNLNQDCPKLKQLLMSIYRRKDQLVERYKANGRQVDEQMSAAGSETVTIPASDMMLFVGFLVCNLKLVWFMWNLASPWSLVAQPLLWIILLTGIISFFFIMILLSLDY